jgi:hypothetical protein
MRLLRRALLLLGLLAGIAAMHGLAPAAGTDVLASGPHQHPEALFAMADPGHGLAAVTADPAGMDGEMPGWAVPVSSGSPSSGAPAPGHGGHGSHLEGLCLAVLAGGIALLLCLVFLGRRGPGATAQALLRRLGAARALPVALRPPDLARLCVLRI